MFVKHYLVIIEDKSKIACFDSKNIYPLGMRDLVGSKLEKGVIAIHLIEKRIEQLFKSGTLGGSLHLSFGQEAVDVGVITAVKPQMVFGNHRSHGQYLAATDYDIEGLFRQLKAGMSQHLYAEDRFMSTGIQGGLVPVSVGYALATGKTAVCFIGDGTFGQGVLYEGLRLASLKKAKVLFVVIDNGYAMGKTLELHHNEFYETAKAFGILCDVHFAMRGAMQVSDAVRRLMAWGLWVGPRLLTIHVDRLCGHSINDTQQYRPKEELSAEWIKARCPFEAAKSTFDSSDFIEQVNRRIDKAVDNVFSI